MDRNALLLYLRDLRDLEIAKRKIKEIYNDEKYYYHKRKNELGVAGVKEVPNSESVIKFSDIKDMLGWAVFFVISIWIAKVLFDWSDWWSGTFVKDILFMFGMIIGIASLVFLFFFIMAIFNVVKRKTNNTNSIVMAKQYNENEKQRVKGNENAILQLEQNWKKREVFLKKEYNRVCSLLEENYSLNILANQYRNLASLYYIYDYMSSSQETLKDTLIHEHMENGIQRILEKLDIIIEQNEKIIFQNRMQESRNSILVEQNNKMLSSLKETEKNTSIAAQYAEISANYSEATVYFSLANYLNN